MEKIFNKLKALVNSNAFNYIYMKGGKRDRLYHTLHIM